MPEHGHLSVSVVGGGPGRKGCIQCPVMGFSGDLHPSRTGSELSGELGALDWAALLRGESVGGGKRREGREGSLAHQPGVTYRVARPRLALWLLQVPPGLYTLPTPRRGETA